MRNEGGGTMSQEKVTVSKAPQHADAWQATVVGCSQVDIAVADVDGDIPRIA